MQDLIVEDGTGLVNADAYISVAYADTYFANRNISAWASAADDDKIAAIRAATQYIDTAYCFKGQVQNPLGPQALMFPRYGLFWNRRGLNKIWPIPRLGDAVAEAALRALQGALIVDTDDERTEAVTVGPIAVKFAHSVQGGQPRYPIIDALISAYVERKTLGGGTIRLQRGA